LHCLIGGIITNEGTRESCTDPSSPYRRSPKSSNTYDIVAEKVGVHRVGLGYFLDAIAKYCLKNEYPLLPVLVVQKGSGRPSAFEKLNCDFDKERERVYRFEWYKLPPVKVEEMK
jgi:hypothetical protein